MSKLFCPFPENFSSYERAFPKIIVDIFLVPKITFAGRIVNVINPKTTVTILSILFKIGRAPTGQVI